MKFLLTSGGISNKTIENELKNLIGKDFKGLKMLFCTTASNYEGGDMDWLIKYFPKINIENLENASKNLQEIDGKKLYIVDDNGAVSVNNENVKIISEGKWFEI